MPKSTFYNLSEEKKKKIILAAKNEYSRVPVSEVSIQNIVQEAKIARGSFYQYFENKSDLLEYIVSNIIKDIINNIEYKLMQCEDIFETYIFIYNEILKKAEVEENRKLCNMLFKDIKIEDSILENVKNKVIKSKMKDLMKIIPKTNLKDKSIDDIRIIIKMLNGITMKAIVCYIKAEDNDKLKKKEEYIKELDFIKYGILSNTCENV